MQTAIIADASCIILLEKINELYLLQSLFDTITITPEIASEVQQSLPEWFIVKEVVNKQYQKLLEETLDEGEASAIALALENDDCLLIIDELKGRKLATQLGITITGTLGVIVDAKHRGLVSSIKPLLEKIWNTNFRLSVKLETEALKEAGEFES